MAIIEGKATTVFVEARRQGTEDWGALQSFGPAHGTVAERRAMARRAINVWRENWHDALNHDFRITER